MYDYCTLIYWRKMIDSILQLLYNNYVSYICNIYTIIFISCYCLAVFGGWSLWFTPTRRSHPFKSTRASMFQHPAYDVWICPSLWNSAGSRRSVRSSGWKTAHLFITPPFEPVCHLCFSVSYSLDTDSWQVIFEILRGNSFTIPC